MWWIPPPSGGAFPTFVLNQRPNELPSLEITGASESFLQSISYPEVMTLDNPQNADEPVCLCMLFKFNVRRSAPVPISHMANRISMLLSGPAPAKGAIAILSDGSIASPVYSTYFLWWTIESGIDSSKSVDWWYREEISLLLLRQRRSKTQQDPKDPFTAFSSNPVIERPVLYKSLTWRLQ